MAPSAEIAEPIRLVVWDLDGTLWKGVLTEGGISEYVQEHHNIIIELARRGIMSSICSKNRPEDVLPVLEKKGILDYFIFPSISWDAKGARLAALIESVRLRPPSVMFIDDNPTNLAEARAFIPGIQVGDVSFISSLLEDPRFKGKTDIRLRRLAQYKLFENRKRDEAQYQGDNHNFLRSCDIRVCIEHDVLNHLDRAIELINRTNQLNFTKRRLPENLEIARATLWKQCNDSLFQAGLVRVIDKYGDYGFVGFYLMRPWRADPLPGIANQTLVHYCFSCRTLGLFVEQWLYDVLSRPALEIVGEVLTDLNEKRTIDWLRLVASASDDSQPSRQIAPEIRISGGCEANSIAHYLTAHTNKVYVTGNFAVGPLFVRTNSCFLLLSAIDYAGPLLEEELAHFGISATLLGASYFRDPPRGTVFVFSGGHDAYETGGRLRHLVHGWEIHVSLGGPERLLTLSKDETDRIMRGKSENEKRQIELVQQHIRENYELANDPTTSSLNDAMSELVHRIPAGSKLIIVLDDERRRNEDGAVRVWFPRVHYNECVQLFAAKYSFVGIVTFRDVVECEDEIFKGGNHYARMVYWRLAQKVIDTAGNIGSKK